MYSEACGQRISSRLVQALTVGIAAMLMAVAAPMATASEWIKLSDGLGFSDVGKFVISPDGRYVAYKHDAAVDGAHELYVAAVQGGTPVRLSALLPSGTVVGAFDFTPDSSRVVYIVPQDDADVYELYSAPVSGGSYTKLNASLESDDWVRTFEISPDGSLVIYGAGDPFNPMGYVNLYSVPVGGGTVQDLGAGAFNFRISPDGTRIVYDVDLPTNLYSVPIGGGPVVQLNPVGTEIYSWAISPDSSRVIFRGTEEGTWAWELYSVPIAGGSPVTLNDPMVTDGFLHFFKISPDGSRVVYVADQETKDADELFSVPIAGGTVVPLNGLLVSGGDVHDFEISPDSSRVIYHADQQTGGVVELYSVPITGGMVVKLNGSLVSGGDVLDFKISPDSAWVVYRADQTLDELPVGYRVPIAGPYGMDEHIWSTPYASSWSDYEIDPTSSYVVVMGNKILVDGVVRLWSANLVGTPQPACTELVPKGDFDPDGDIAKFEMGPYGNIVYRGDQDIDGEIELYSIPIVVFVDGFETGDPSAWSRTVP
jgi:Tol biopolymer transport system component